MSLRQFKDISGRVWLVWKVAGGFHPQRSGRERRSARTSFSGVERRSGAERRGTKPPPPWANGWLCFESLDERRRLMPVPEKWEACTEEELDRYRRMAQLSRA